MKSEQKTYLVQEAVLFLLFSYLVLLGGTFNGLVLFRIFVISAVLITVSGLIWIIYRRKYRDRSVGTVLDLPIGFFFTSVLISTAFSSDPRRSLIRLGGFLLGILVFYLVVDLTRGGLSTQLVIKCLLLVSMFIIFFGIREIWIWYKGWLAISPALEIIPPATYRVRAFIGHPNFVAAFFNLLIPLALSLFVGKKHLPTRVIVGVWVSLALLLVFFTSSRGGWLGTLAAIGTVSLLSVLARPGIMQDTWLKIKRKWWLGAGAGVVVTGIGFLIIRALGWQASHPSHPSDIGNITASRDYIWGVAWRMFLENTIVGNGPFTYATEYIENASVPPGMLLAHAHNFYLNIAAEQGILGLLSMGGLVIGVIYLCWKAWLTHQYLNRIELAGLFGALAGLSVHSLVETPQTLPMLLLLPAIMIGLIAAGLAPTDRKFCIQLKNGILSGTVLIGLSLLGWYTASFYPYQQGLLQAEAGNWIEAERLFEKAIKRDPENALYWFELGYLQGVESLSSQQAVSDYSQPQLAIRSYQEGFSLEPNYSLNHLNVGLLYWRNGNIEEAKKEFETAVGKAPDQAGFSLTLGGFLEEEGFLEQASEVYLKTLDLEPQWAQSEFFRETQFREKIKSSWDVQNLGYPEAFDIDLMPGWEMLQAQEYQSAAEFFESQLDTNYPEAYFGLGVSQLALEDEIAALQSLLTVDWMGSKNDWLVVLTKFKLGSIYKSQGRCPVAVPFYREGLEKIESANVYGLGRRGIDEYALYAFYRFSQTGDTLPGYLDISYPDQVISALVDYVDCLESSEQKEEAKRVSEIITQVRSGLRY